MERDRVTFGVTGSAGCTRRHMMMVLAIMSSKEVTIIDTDKEYTVFHRLEEKQKGNK